MKLNHLRINLIVLLFTVPAALCAQVTDDAVDVEAVKKNIESQPAPTTAEEVKEKAAEITEDPPEQEATDQSTKPIPPSEISKHLNGRMLLETNYHATSIQADKGSWGTSMNSDIAILYRLKTQPIGKDSGLWVSSRYDPNDVTVSYQNRPYRGITETLWFGARLTDGINAKTLWYTGLELGFTKVSLHTLDEFKENDDLEQGGASFGASAGIQYLAMEKLMINWSVIIGAGSLSSAETGIGTSFIF